MKIPSKKLNRFLLTLILMAFFGTAFFGVSQPMMDMSKQNDETMEGCLFTNLKEICKMSLTEHINQWKSTFTATVPQKVLALSLLLLFSVIFIAVGFFKRNLSLLFSYCATQSQLYLKQNPNFSLFNTLREAFSQGLLNPKIY